MGIEIDNAIREAITKNLSAEVGALLQARLKQADTDAMQVRMLQDSLNRAQGEAAARAIAEKEVARLTDALKAQAEQAKALALKELELSYKEKMMALREAMANTRVEDLKDVVKTVFCSPVSKSKVYERSSEPLVHPQTGYQQGQKDITRSVESESTGPGLQLPG